jgi:hypothetical protein
MSELLNVLRHVHKIINIFYNFIVHLQSSQISPLLGLIRCFFSNSSSRSIDEDTQN